MVAWTEVRSAYMVAKLGTVSAAADALGCVHHATILRHIDALETELSSKLFQRHKHGYTPTDVGPGTARSRQPRRRRTDPTAGPRPKPTGRASRRADHHRPARLRSHPATRHDPHAAGLPRRLPPRGHHRAANADGIRRGPRRPARRAPPHRPGFRRAPPQQPQPRPLCPQELPPAARPSGLKRRLRKTPLLRRERGLRKRPAAGMDRSRTRHPRTLSYAPTAC